MVWSQRKRGEECDVDDIYYPDSEWFSIELHHGGEFEYIPHRVYTGGIVDYFDFCNGDAMSIQEINKMIKWLGYDGIMFYHFKMPTQDLDNGLRVLGSDDDMLIVCNLGRKHKLIEIYLEHGTTNCDHHFVREPRLKSSVVIEELNENENENDIVGVGSDTSNWVVSSRNRGILSDLLLTYTVEEIAGVAAGFEAEFVAEQGNERQQSENESDHENVNDHESDHDNVESDYDNDNEKEKSDHENEFTNDQEEQENEEEESDSEYDQFGDPDYDWSGDDRDDIEFETNIDASVEWAGVRDDDESVEEVNDVGRNKGKEEIRTGDDEINNVESDYASSDDLWSIPSSDDETRPRKKGLDFHAETEMRNPTYKLHKRFSNAKEIKQALKEYSIKNMRDIYLVKNDKERIRAKCRGSKTCPWVILFSPMQLETTWEVKTFVDVHTCSLTYTNKALTSEWIARRYIERFRSTPNWTLEGIMVTVREDYHVDITRVQAYKAKRMADELNHGNGAVQYSLLWDYCQEIRRTNPNSTMKIEVRDEVDVNAPDERKFKRIYCCLGPLKAGFAAGCRKVLSLDGCFLKGEHKGQILTAIGMDANNGMYPLAYAVVEAENRDNWQWFLELLIDDMGIDSREKWVFLSDQQKGLDLALSHLLPNVEHRYCLLHMYNNFKKLFKGKEIKNKLYKAAFATTVCEFKAAMEDFKASFPDGFEWASHTPPIHWSKSHFTEEVKSDVLMNNIAESFNSHIVYTRDKPIISMLEMIRSYLMTRIRKKRDELKKCENHVLSSVQKSINKRKEEAMDYSCTWNGETKYQIKGPWGEQCVVDLSAKTCSCRRWQLTGVPCKHGVSAIWYDGKKGEGNGVPEMWVDECYKLGCQARIYEHTINPINGSAMWEHVDNVFKIVPPIFHKQPGRPKKARRKAVDEVRKQPKNAIPTKVRRTGKVITCSRCGLVGHNSRVCKGQGCLPLNKRKKDQAGSSNNEGSGGRSRVSRGTINVRGRGRGRSSTSQASPQDSTNINVETNHSPQVTLTASQLTPTTTQENPRDALNDHVAAKKRKVTKN